MLLTQTSFLVADRAECFIIETYERFWVWRRVHGIAAISNQYSITTNWDRASLSLIEWAISKGHCTREHPVFNFATIFGSNVMEVFAQGSCRRNQIFEALERADSISVATCMRVLRMHSHEPTCNEFDPSSLAATGKQTVCMHYAGQVRRAQTTGSVISHLAQPNPQSPEVPESDILDTHWVTGTSSPCLSVFKPLIGVDALQQDLISPQFYAPDSIWWKGELLHRLVLKKFAERSSLVRARVHILELQSFEHTSRFSEIGRASCRERV